MHSIRAYLLLGVGAMLGLAVLFFFTNPEEVPSVVLFLAFGGTYCLIVSGAMVFMLAMRRLGGFDWQTARLRKNILLFALLPTFLLLLRSIGQLTPRDVLLVFIFTLIAYLYIHRMSQQPGAAE